MMRWYKYAVCLLLCMVFYSVYVIPGYAQDWVLDETSYEDFAVSDDALIATGSDAGIALLSSYSQPYDGSISTTYTTYFRGVVESFRQLLTMFCSGRISIVTGLFIVTP